MLIRALALTLSLAAAGPALADSTVAYIAQDFSFSGPDTIPAGLTTVKIVNQGKDAHQIQLLKLPPGKSVADVMAAIKANHTRLPPWVERRGGPNAVVPGEQATALLNLDPGEYILICGIPDHRGIPHIALGMQKPVRVLPGSAEGQPQPQPDLTVSTLDFSFELSGPISPGRKTIRVINNGSQPHEIVLVRLQPGAAIRDFAAAFQPGIPESPAGKPVGGMVGLERGGEGYIVADFVAGNYGLICFLPDLIRGAPHFARGMLLDIQVK
jgi:hypothetical protein